MTKLFLKVLIFPFIISVGQDVPVAVKKSSNEGMVVSNDRRASEAGIKIIEDGGTAIDALVAVQIILGLVEPQSSGLGGGSFAVYYDSKTKKITTFDGREKAPSSATEDRFTSTDNFFRAWQSGLSVGVPGTVKLLEVMHKKYGKKDWSKLFDDAIHIAENGFAMTSRTADSVASLLGYNAFLGFTECDRLLFRDSTAFEYMADPETCTGKPAGTIVTNAEYAETLKAIRDHGAKSFYTGHIAKAIVAAVTGDIAIPGDMTVDDLANYDVVEREPVCIKYRKNYEVCGMGPPSSGGLAVGQILGIMDNFETIGSPLDVENVHLFTQASRLAFADRARYAADSDFVTVPVEGLLHKDYLASRATHVGMFQDTEATYGTPPGKFDAGGKDGRIKTTGTTHISIVDSFGNAVSVTSSIESAFGNGVMVKGFFLNNELTDFSFASVDEDGTPVANRVQGNKRPRSSMSPTIVLNKHGDLDFLTGSPGGSYVIGFTSQSIVNIIDFGLDAQQAINVPHILNRNDKTSIEAPMAGITDDYDVEALKLQLENLDHDVTVSSTLASGLGVIRVEKSGKKGTKKGPKNSKKGTKNSKKGTKNSKKSKKGEKSMKRKDLLVGGADFRRLGSVA